MDYGWAIMLIVVVLIIAAFFILIGIAKEVEDKRQIDELTSGIIEVSPAEFFRLRKKGQNFAGCYILHNTTTGWYYIGQSIHVLNRVNQHFTGHGKDTVYYDWAYRKHSFTIKMVPLSGSGYRTLNELERKLIARYKAYYHGYNLTRGNRG